MSSRRNRDVVIVGAGVTGLSTAFELASQGAGEVTVLERDRIGAGASGVQPGGVRQQWGTAVNCRLAREAFFFYRDIHERLETSARPRLSSCGYVFLAESDEVMAQLRDNVALQNSLGIPSDLMTPEEAAEVVPDLMTETLVGAAYCAEDGYFDNAQAPVEAYAEAATRHGAQIEHAEVQRLERTGAAWTVVLADGSSICAEHVVIAAGYDTPPLLRPLGIRLPIEKERRYLFMSAPINERLLDPLVVATERHFAAKHLADGRILASDLLARGEATEAGRQQWRQRIDEQIEKLLPRLQFVSFPLLVEGHYDMTPDGQPILGPVGEHANLWIAAGFSGHGFMLAPAVSRRLARAVLDGVMAEEFEEFSATRFRGEGLDGLVHEPQVF
ncbi:NAD(P)/FAD-dependent oxidoreductase [Egibacter rhizosphaerae]|nr:FAD-binding oxidoreductase [Egibacter rhizosphaerae]